MKNEMEGHVAHMGKNRGHVKDAGWKTEGKETNRKTFCRWENNIKTNLQEIGGSLDSIDLAQDRDRWWTVVNAVMNFRVPQKWGTI